VEWRCFCGRARWRCCATDTALGGPRERSMAAFNVVVLRSLCAECVDARLAPLLEELRQVQAQCKQLAAALEEQKATNGGGGAQPGGQSEEELATAARRLAATEEEPGPEPKADLVPDPAMTLVAQLEELSAKVQMKANAKDVLTAPQVQELIASAEVRAARSKVACPTMLQFDELSKHVGVKADAEALLELRGLVEELTSEIRRKASAEAIPSTAQLRKLIAQEAPTLLQFEELRGTVDEKADANNVATSAQLERLVATVERKARQQKELATCVAGKADIDLVPTLAQVESLSQVLGRKANAESVPSRDQVRKLAASLEQAAAKADQVGNQLEELAAAVELKANIHDTATISQIEDLLAARDGQNKQQSQSPFLETPEAGPQTMVWGVCMDPNYACAAGYWNNNFAPSAAGSWNCGGGSSSSGASGRTTANARWRGLP